jgi:hypothetical protein
MVRERKSVMSQRQSERRCPRRNVKSIDCFDCAMVARSLADRINVFDSQSLLLLWLSMSFLRCPMRDKMFSPDNDTFRATFQFDVHHIHSLTHSQISSQFKKDLFSRNTDRCLLLASMQSVLHILGWSLECRSDITLDDGSLLHAFQLTVHDLDLHWTLFEPYSAHLGIEPFVV